MTYRVFIGTMYSGENEFPASVVSVRMQKNVEIEHYFVSGKTEIGATTDLYAKWTSIKHEFDAFVQVDADVELPTNDVIFRAVDSLLKNHPDCNSTIFPLKDWLTKTSIMGLNVYTPSVEFVTPSKPGWTDRSQINMNKFVESEVIALHSQNPSFQQSFHFGFNRGIKKRFEQREQILKAYKSAPDDRRIIAIQGFDASHRYTDYLVSSYSHDVFREEYVKACIDFPTFKAKL